MKELEEIIHKADTVLIKAQSLRSTYRKVHMLPANLYWNGSLTKVIINPVQDSTFVPLFNPTKETNFAQRKNDPPDVQAPDTSITLGGFPESFTQAVQQYEKILENTSQVEKTSHKQQFLDHLSKLSIEDTKENPQLESSRNYSALLLACNSVSQKLLTLVKSIQDCGTDPSELYRMVYLGQRIVHVNSLLLQITEQLDNKMKTIQSFLMDCVAFITNGATVSEQKLESRKILTATHTNDVWIAKTPIIGKEKLADTLQMLKFLPGTYVYHDVNELRALVRLRFHIQELLLKMELETLVMDELFVLLKDKHDR